MKVITIQQQDQPKVIGWKQKKKESEKSDKHPRRQHLLSQGPGGFPGTLAAENISDFHHTLKAEKLPAPAPACRAAAGPEITLAVQ